MRNLQDNEIWEDLGELQSPNYLKNVPRAPRKPAKAKPVPAAQPPAPVAEILLAEETEQQKILSFTYQPSRYEAVWIRDSLGGFFEQQWFDDVLRMVKGGKEASVYLCQANPSAQMEWIAAKVYRPRRFRNLKNDHMYREGRDNLDSAGNVITNDGMLHAMRKRTEYGRELLHASWIEHEYQTMCILHQAGADIPRPLTSGNNAILMEYIGDLDGCAPTLNSVDLDREEARQLFERVIHNIELMLAHNRIHGDLSAYNILYWEGEISIIDFPQAIHPDQNINALRIFERDIARVCEYFRAQGVPSDPKELAHNLWQKNQHRLLPVADPQYLDADNPDDRRYWETNR